MKQGKRQSLDYGRENRPTVSRAMAQFSLLGGGAAWLLHLLGVYVISEFGCGSGWGNWIVAGLSMVAWLLALATLVTGALAGAAIWASVCSERQMRQSYGEEEPVVAAENKLFVSRVALILNAVFLFIILVQAIPIAFYLRAC